MNAMKCARLHLKMTQVEFGKHLSLKLGLPSPMQQCRISAYESGKRPSKAIMNAISGDATLYIIRQLNNQPAANWEAIIKGVIV